MFSCRYFIFSIGSIDMSVNYLFSFWHIKFSVLPISPNNKYQNIDWEKWVGTFQHTHVNYQTGNTKKDFNPYIWICLGIYSLINFFLLGIYSSIQFHLSPSPFLLANCSVYQNLLYHICIYMITTNLILIEMHLLFNNYNYTSLHFLEIENIFAITNKLQSYFII